jgi:hypothetical protein
MPALAPRAVDGVGGSQFCTGAEVTAKTVTAVETMMVVTFLTFAFVSVIL